MLSTEAEKYRKYHNWVVQVIELLQASLQRRDITWRQRLEYLDSIDRTMPEARRLAIYLLNKELGNNEQI